MSASSLTLFFSIFLPTGMASTKSLRFDMYEVNNEKEDWFMEACARQSKFTADTSRHGY